MPQLLLWDEPSAAEATGEQRPARIRRGSRPPGGARPSGKAPAAPGDLWAPLQAAGDDALEVPAALSEAFQPGVPAMAPAAGAQQAPGGDSPLAPHPDPLAAAAGLPAHEAPFALEPSPAVSLEHAVESTGPAVFRHPAAQHEVHLGHALVAFELKRVRRRSIGMAVGPEGLSVRAPRWVGLPEIERALREKARWICTKLDEQRQRHRQEQDARIEWREGGVVPVLGEPVVLVLDGRISGAALRDREPPPAADEGQNIEARQEAAAPARALHLGLPQQAGTDQIRDVATAWLQRHAKAFFESRVRHFAEQLGVAVKRVSLTSARTRWGSASADGSIRLHWRLVHFSPAIVDYVVAHELAHLREMNHSPRFWDVVRSVLPEYDAAREQLRQAVIPA